MEWPEIAEKFGRDLVESVHDQVLADYLRMWDSRETEVGRALGEAGLSDDQRRVVWRILAGAVETTYHHFVHWLDQKVEFGELSVRLIDEDRPQDSCEWRQAQVGMPYGFSADMIERYGADPEKLYDQARRVPAPLSERQADDLPDVKEFDERATQFMDALQRRVISEGRCMECGRPTAALRRTCKTCGQAY